MGKKGRTVPSRDGNALLLKFSTFLGWYCIMVRVYTYVALVQGIMEVHFKYLSHLQSPYSCVGGTSDSRFLIWYSNKTRNRKYFDYLKMKTLFFLSYFWYTWAMKRLEFNVHSRTYIQLFVFFSKFVRGKLTPQTLSFMF